MSNETPKPKPPVRKPQTTSKKPEPIKEDKKPYIRKPHLTHRPFSDDELLAKLVKDTGTQPTTRRGRKEKKDR